MSKLLTIVIPTYNMERLLSKCLDSLLVPDIQLMQQLEVLVVIDGAKDRSSEIAHQYEDKYPCVFRVIDKENGNYGSCVNRGLKEATGKYIKILDADDQFDTSSLERVMKKLLSMDVDLVLTNYKTIDEGGNVTGRKDYQLIYNEILPVEELSSLGPHMAMHSVIYKTENLRRIGYRQTEGISYTDQEWIFEPMTAVNNFIYLNEYLYLYLVGREGQTMDIKAMSKNMHHNLIVLKRDAEVLNATNNNACIYSYLWGRITSFALSIYNTYLYNTKIMDMQKFIEFDKEFETLCPRLYEHTMTFKAGKLPFVRLWRTLYYTNDYGINRFFAERKYRRNLPFVSSAYSKIKNKLKS